MEIENIIKSIETLVNGKNIGLFNIYEMQTNDDFLWCTLKNLYKYQLISVIRKLHKQYINQKEKIDLHKLSKDELINYLMKKDRNIVEEIIDKLLDDYL